MITHLEPDTLEHEVKWALGSITTNKANGGDGIPVELFHILKDDAVKVPGASMRNSTSGKGHEEGGSAHAKAGSSLKSPPGNSRASTPKTRVCLLYCFVPSPTPLTLREAVLAASNSLDPLGLDPGTPQRIFTPLPAKKES